jgi:hypothetical protein
MERKEEMRLRRRTEMRLRRRTEMRLRRRVDGCSFRDHLEDLRRKMHWVLGFALSR